MKFHITQRIVQLMGPLWRFFVPLICLSLLLISLSLQNRVSKSVRMLHDLRLYIRTLCGDYQNISSNLLKDVTTQTAEMLEPGTISWHHQKYQYRYKL